MSPEDSRKKLQQVPEVGPGWSKTVPRRGKEGTNLCIDEGQAIAASPRDFHASSVSVRRTRSTTRRRRLVEVAGAQGRGRLWAFALWPARRSLEGGPAGRSVRQQGERATQRQQGRPQCRQ
ncbi:unnamed protein product, partial [Prorocentrum cordatum]